MSLRQLVAYAHTQQERADLDEKHGVSNLYNEGKAHQDDECAQLCSWVASHVHVGEDGNSLTISEYEVGGKKVPTNTYACVPWFRYAQFKKVAVQIVTANMLHSPDWNFTEKERSLVLPRPKPRLPQQRVHACMSAHDVCSRVFLQKQDMLDAKEPRVNVMTLEEDARDITAASIMIIIMSGDNLVASEAYQTDIRAAIDAGKTLLLVLDTDTRIEEVRSSLRAQASGVFSSYHIQRLFDPIAMYAMPTLFDEEHRVTLFDEATLWQVAQKVTATLLQQKRRQAAERAANAAAKAAQKSGLARLHRQKSAASNIDRNVVSDQGQNPMGLNPMHTPSDTESTGSASTGTETPQVVNPMSSGSSRLSTALSSESTGDSQQEETEAMHI
jgi:hypothetical protein